MPLAQEATPADPPAGRSSDALHRLRAACLRPTIARIAILQVVEAAGPQAVSTEDVLRRVALRGTHVAMGTAYRVLQQMHERGLLLREWGDGPKALYRLRPYDVPHDAVVLVCRRSGRSVRVIDPVLHERLQAAAGRLGLALAGRQVCIEVGEVEGPVPVVMTGRTGRWPLSTSERRFTWEN